MHAKEEGWGRKGFAARGTIRTVTHVSPEGEEPFEVPVHSPISHNNWHLEFVSELSACFKFNSGAIGREVSSTLLLFIEQSELKKVDWFCDLN